jgi:hypothetical protein
MKLSDIHSQELLPRFAHDISWVMDALDSVIKPTAYRVKSLDAPLTLEAIQALSESDLVRLYEQYGVAKYYPDLSRSTRDMMLYQMCRIYRYLGTPKAVEILCNYIFDSLPLNLEVLDNLAFDADGNLIDSDLLDLFDIKIKPLEPVLDEDTNARILANIIRFSRNSQALRDILYDFVQTFSVDVKWALDSTNPEVTQTWIQDSLCEPVVIPNVIEKTFGFMYFGGNPKWIKTNEHLHDSSQNLEIVSSSDATDLTNFGLTIAHYGGGYHGPYGQISSTSINCTYELLALYTDISDSGEGTGEVAFSAADYSVVKRWWPSDEILNIKYANGNFIHGVSGCKLRITKPTT